MSEEDIHQVMDQFGDVDKKTLKDKSPKTFLDPLLSNQIAKVEEDIDDENLNDESNSESEFSESDVDTEKTEDKETDDETESIMNSWRELFGEEDYFAMLKEKAAKGRLNTFMFRNLCWKVFLDVIQEERHTWKEDILQQRAVYEGLRQQHLQSPHKDGADVDLSLNNPLSQDLDSPWHQYFVDAELRALIEQDVNRLFPGIEFFERAEVRISVVDILFCFAKQHPHMSYRQGMHEIVGPILYVHINEYNTVKDSEETLDELITFLQDTDFIEHDTYYLFSHIMDVIEPWYTQLENVGKSPQASKNGGLFTPQTSLRASSAICKKLNRIQNFMLKRYDHQLFSHLKKLDVEPQLYGIRWIRLLFGREYDFADLLKLWDVLFADGPTLDLVDYIYLAMLMNIRNLLLRSDYSTCMTYLMNYPRPDISYVTMKAMSLRENKTSRPSAHPPRHNNSSATQVSHTPHGTRTSHSRNRLKETLTEEQQFAKALGSSVSQPRPKKTPPNRLSQSANATVQWYQHKDQSNESTPIQNAATRRRQTIERLQRDPTPVEKHEVDPDYHRHIAIKNAQQQHQISYAQQQQQQYQQQQQQRSSNIVTSQISSMLNKHMTTSPTQVLSKLTTKAKPRGKDNELMSRLVEDHQRLQRQISQLQSDFDRLQSLCLFCGGKMESYLGFLQTAILESEHSENNAALLSVAGLKQVKDVLNSTADFKGTGKEHETDFTVIDRQISKACCTDSPTTSSEESNTISKEREPENKNLVTSEADYDHYDKENLSLHLPQPTRSISPKQSRTIDQTRSDNRSDKRSDSIVTMRSLSSDEFGSPKILDDIGGENNSLFYSGMSDPLSNFQML